MTEWPAGPYRVRSEINKYKNHGFYIGNEEDIVAEVNGFKSDPGRKAVAALFAAAPELYAQGAQSACLMEAIAGDLSRRGLVDLADELRLQAKAQRLILAKCEIDR